MLGLTALAALMAMTFVGTGSAMAESTALCKEDAVLLSGEVCPEAKRISHVHEVSVGKGVLLSSLVTIECEVLFLGDVTSANNLGAPLVISGNFTYPMTGCETTGGTLCTVTETSASATIEVLKTAHELAEVKGTAEVNAQCGIFINCTYNGVGLLGHGLGPLLSSSLNGNVGLSEKTTNKIGGFLCPKTAKLDLTTTPLEHTYIADGAHSTALCKEDAVPLVGEVCSEAKRISHVHEVSVGKGVLLTSLVTIECEVLFLGDVTLANNLGAPLVISGNFTYPMTGCETTGGTLCEITETSVSATIEILKTGHELAEFKGTFEWNIHCGALINCTYNGVGLLGHALGPLLSSSLNGNVGFSEQTTNKISGVICPKTTKLDLTTTPLEHTYIAS